MKFHVFLICIVPLQELVWFGIRWGLNLQQFQVESSLKPIRLVVGPPTDLIRGPISID